MRIKIKILSLHLILASSSSICQTTKLTRYVANVSRKLLSFVAKSIVMETLLMKNSEFIQRFETALNTQIHGHKPNQ